jgi:hypothetical protein
LLILDLGNNAVSAMVGDKKGVCNYQTFDKYGGLIFDGLKISTSMLRHIYLTDKLKDVPKLVELEQLASDMGHSLKEQLEYVKH